MSAICTHWLDGFTRLTLTRYAIADLGSLVTL
jgi:hypothetical protein